MAYSVLVVLVALGGLAFVFYATGSDDTEGDGEGLGWSQWALTIVVGAFLAVMVGGLLT